MSPWVGIAVLVLSLLALLVLVRLLRSKFGLHPEVSRKANHVGLGLATLTFPILFDSVWPVAVLGLSTIAVLAALRWLPTVNAQFGGVVHGVERRGWGDFYFPIAATGLFVLARGDMILFGIPMLALALADAVAALVGVYYGRTQYETGEGRKSLEGSVAFFTVAFLATHIPLLLLTTTGRAESLLIGVIFGVLVMLVEAVSLRGTDNLFVPFGGFLLLDAFMQKTALELGAALLVLFLLLTLVLLLRKQRTMTDAAMLAGVLLGFVTWSVGGLLWLVPPLVVFLVYTALWPRRQTLQERPHDMVALASFAAAGLLWLLLGHVLRRPDFFYPYTISYAADLVFLGITWYRHTRPRLHPLAMVARSALTAWVAIFPVYVAVTPLERVGVSSIAALACLLAGGIGFSYIIPFLRGTTMPFPWVTQSLVGVAVSALGLLLLPLAGGAS
jgi:phytol kinase